MFAVDVDQAFNVKVVFFTFGSEDDFGVFATSSIRASLMPPGI